MQIFWKEVQPDSDFIGGGLFDRVVFLTNNSDSTAKKRSGKWVIWSNKREMEDLNA
jgi:hypothetical protein